MTTTKKNFFEGKTEEAVRLRYSANQSTLKKAVAQMVPQRETYTSSLCTSPAEVPSVPQLS